MVKDRGGPVQDKPPLVNVGVTLMVARYGSGVVLMATKEKIGPLPLSGNPMRVTLLVHVNVVPVTGLVKNTAAVLSRSQRI